MITFKWKGNKFIVTDDYCTLVNIDISNTTLNVIVKDDNGINVLDTRTFKEKNNFTCCIADLNVVKFNGKNNLIKTRNTNRQYEIYLMKGEI